MSRGEPPEEAIPPPILRDLFAMAALVAIGTWGPAADLTDDDTIRQRADWCYRQADAMVAARAAKGED